MAPEVEPASDAPVGRPSRLPDVVALAAVAAVYLLSFQRGPGLADSIKWGFVPYGFGTGHATGYPLYSIVSGAFGHLVPFGAIATRANLFSSFSTVVACALLVAILRELRLGWFARVVAVAGYALSPWVWSQGTVAEVYAWSMVGMGAVVWLGVRVLRRNRRVEAMALTAVFLLCFANHLTVVTLAPAVAVVLVLHVRNARDRARALLALGAAALVGGAGVALLYLYLPLRAATGAPYVESVVTSGSDLLYVLRGAQFESIMFSVGPDQLVHDRIPSFSRELWRDLSLFLVAVPFGLWRLRRVGAFLLVALVGLLAFDLEYAIDDIYVYLLPVAFVAVIAAAGALDWLWSAARGRSIVRVACVVAAVWALVTVGRAGADQIGRERVLAADTAARDGSIHATGPGIIVSQTGTGVGYEAFIRSQYGLIADGRGQQESLWLVLNPEPEDVMRYQRGDASVWDDVARGQYRAGPVTTDPPPAGLTVYVIDADMATLLGKRGFQVTQVDPSYNLWTVVPLG